MDLEQALATLFRQREIVDLASSDHVLPQRMQPPGSALTRYSMSGFLAQYVGTAIVVGSRACDTQLLAALPPIDEMRARGAGDLRVVGA